MLGAQSGSHQDSRAVLLCLLVLLTFVKWEHWHRDSDCLGAESITWVGGWVLCRHNDVSATHMTGAGLDMRTVRVGEEDIADEGGCDMLMMCWHNLVFGIYIVVQQVFCRASSISARFRLGVRSEHVWTFRDMMDILPELVPPVYCLWTGLCVVLQCLGNRFSSEFGPSLFL